MRNLQSKPEIKINNLGQIASAIYNINKRRSQQADEMMEDLDAFYAPGECYGDAFRGFSDETENLINEVFEHFGVTREQYRQEINTRIDVSFELNYMLF